MVEVDLKSLGCNFYVIHKENSFIKYVLKCENCGRTLNLYYEHEYTEMKIRMIVNTLETCQEVMLKNIL